MRLMSRRWGLFRNVSAEYSHGMSWENPFTERTAGSGRTLPNAATPQISIYRPLTEACRSQVIRLPESGRWSEVGPDPKLPLVSYSITLSARTKIDCGIVRPSALAVFMLITSSNLVGSSTGRSPGFAPLRILSTKVAARRYISARSAP